MRLTSWERKFWQSAKTGFLCDVSGYSCAWRLGGPTRFALLWYDLLTFLEL